MVLAYKAGLGEAWRTCLGSTPANFSHAFDISHNGARLASRCFILLLMSSEVRGRSIVSICSADVHSRGTSPQRTALVGWCIVIMSIPSYATLKDIDCGCKARYCEDRNDKDWA